MIELYYWEVCDYWLGVNVHYYYLFTVNICAVYVLYNSIFLGKRIISLQIAFIATKRIESSIDRASRTKSKELCERFGRFGGFDRFDRSDFDAL